MSHLLATPEDLGEAAEGVDPDEVERVLAQASSIVRGYTRQHLSRVTDDEAELEGNWSQRLVLPERPVASVASVAINGSEVSYQRVRDQLWRTHWGGPRALVEVVYTHGFDPVPDDIVSVVVQAALRGLPNNRLSAVVSQETLADYSRTLRSSTSLTAADQHVLDLYRRRVRT